jgi:hypothetical protein
MDIVSPLFTEETVTDIDVEFSSGRVKELTLFPADSYVDTPGGIDVNIAIPREAISLNKAHIAWYSIRERVIRRPIAKPITADSQSPAQ